MKKGTADEDEAQHLKQVSRIKHVILQKYLPPWEQILGSRHSRICCFDCYAGPGIYECQDQMVDGSPIIAIRAATAYLTKSIGRQMTLILIEKFFMVDPYGHPLTIPILNQILSRNRTEALINFMYYRINMDAGNPKVQHHLDEMFGDTQWRQQSFLQHSGSAREIGFRNYFIARINAKYKLWFRIQFDPEDNIKGNRTKYYLIHASNHVKAVLLMKEVMWPLGDEEGIFDYSAKEPGLLFSRSPSDEELRASLLREYSGKEIGFDILREETWQWPFIEKHYRAVIKQLKAEGLVTITPITSKTDRGLKQKDRICFLGSRGGGGWPKSQL